MVKGKNILVYACICARVDTCSRSLSLSLFSFRVKNERSDGRRARVENRRTINRKKEKEGRKERERGLVWFKSSLASLLSSNSRCYGDNLERPPRSTQNPPLPSLIFIETFGHSFEISNRLWCFDRSKKEEKDFLSSFSFLFFQFFHSQGELSRRRSRNSSKISIRSFRGKFLALFRSPRGSTPPVVTCDSLLTTPLGEDRRRDTFEDTFVAISNNQSSPPLPHKWN